MSGSDRCAGGRRALLPLPVIPAREVGAIVGAPAFGALLRATGDAQGQLEHARQAIRRDFAAIPCRDDPEPGLAAGSIEPKDGFKYAFDNGADFICVGMYDFQVVDDANMALTAIKDTKNRVRPWRAV